MLGERTGTGYTEGSPYLKEVQTIPVFLSLAQDQNAEPVAVPDLERGDDLAPSQTLDVIPPRGRCPFASGALSLAMPTAAGA